MQKALYPKGNRISSSNPINQKRYQKSRECMKSQKDVQICYAYIKFTSTHNQSTRRKESKSRRIERMGLSLLSPPPKGIICPLQQLHHLFPNVLNCIQESTFQIDVLIWSLPLQVGNILLELPYFTLGLRQFEVEPLRLSLELPVLGFLRVKNVLELLLQLKTGKEELAIASHVFRG